MQKCMGSTFCFWTSVFCSVTSATGCASASDIFSCSSYKTRMSRKRSRVFPVALVMATILSSFALILAIISSLVISLLFYGVNVLSVDRHVTQLCFKLFIRERVYIEAGIEIHVDVTQFHFLCVGGIPLLDVLIFHKLVRMHGEIHLDSSSVTKVFDYLYLAVVPTLNYAIGLRAVIFADEGNGSHPQ